MDEINEQRRPIPKGAWVIVHHNGIASKSPFIFTSEEIENLRRNSRPDETYILTSPGTREFIKIRGTGFGSGGSIYR